MASFIQPLLNLDPEHISCIGGRTVVTCKGCAGNAPRSNLPQLQRPRLQHLRLCTLQPHSCSSRSQSNREPHSCICRNTRLLGTVIPRLAKSQLLDFESFTC
ncbi:unnamed protein product [Penicillium nalgiovense]|nr:unnamed protein product [Penicillium nalgiovense]